MGGLAALELVCMMQATLDWKKMSHMMSIEQARSSSLRGSVAAMARAANQARRTAAQTQTAVVVERNGVLEHLYISATQTVIKPITVSIEPQEGH
jgi:hypothetical protein